MLKDLCLLLSWLKVYDTSHGLTIENGPPTRKVPKTGYLLCLSTSEQPHSLKLKQTTFNLLCSTEATAVCTRQTLALCRGHKRSTNTCLSLIQLSELYEQGVELTQPFNWFYGYVDQRKIHR